MNHYYIARERDLQSVLDTFEDCTKVFKLFIT